MRREDHLAAGREVAQDANDLGDARRVQAVFRLFDQNEPRRLQELERTERKPVQHALAHLVGGDRGPVSEHDAQALLVVEVLQCQLLD